MSDYNWCHGPDCHTYKTQSRVRGSKGNKVLRTIKIKETKWNEGHAFKYFCNQNCLYGFINKHLEELVKIAPRREALETPITDPKKTTHTSENNWGNHSWTTTDFEVVGVDND